MYDYYVTLMEPKWTKVTYPAGLFRCKKSALILEAIGRSGKWFFSDNSTEEWLNGQLDLTKVDEATAKKAMANMFPEMKAEAIDKLFK